MKTIGVIGTRRRNSREDFNIVRDKFYTVYVPEDRVCSGLCYTGGDWFAVLIALGMDWIEDEEVKNKIYTSLKYNRYFIPKYKIPPVWYPAEWGIYGKKAGFVRNIDIANTSDVLIACVSEDRTGGTEDTIKKFISLKGNDKNLFII